MKKKTAKGKRKRPLNTGPKSEVGQARKLLYQNTLKRIKEAQEAGFALEAITLLESVISDRLEARLAAVGLNCKTGGQFWPLSEMARTLAGKRCSDDDKAKKVYREVPEWAMKRNKAMHGVAKLAKTDDEVWEQKYESAKQAADEGYDLFRKLDKTVKRLNKP